MSLLLLFGFTAAGAVGFTTAPAAVNPNNSNKESIFKNCAPLNDCISEINNRQYTNR